MFTLLQQFRGSSTIASNSFLQKKELSNNTLKQPSALLLQPKISVSASNDTFDREADKISVMYLFHKAHSAGP